MKISRLNYDKPHRCPGWSGGGWRGGPEPSRCPGASFASFLYFRKGTFGRSRFWQWRPVRCPECKIVCLPYATRWLDRTWLAWHLVQRRRVYGLWPYK